MDAPPERALLRLPLLYGYIAKAEARQSKSALYSYLLFVKSAHNGDLGALVQRVSFSARAAPGEPADRPLGEAPACPYFLMGTQAEGFRVRCVVELRAPFAHCPLELDFEVEGGDRNKGDKRVSLCANSDELLLQNCPAELRAALEAGLARSAEPAYRGELVEAALNLRQPDAAPYRQRLAAANAFLAEEIELAAARLAETEAELRRLLAPAAGGLQKRDHARSASGSVAG